MVWLSPKQIDNAKNELIGQQAKEIKAYKEALKRIADNYDNVEDLAGVIAREILDKYKD
jgi:hypothetical protein